MKPAGSGAAEPAPLFELGVVDVEGTINAWLPLCLGHRCTARPSRSHAALWRVCVRLGALLHTRAVPRAAQIFSFLIEVYSNSF